MDPTSPVQTGLSADQAVNQFLPEVDQEFSRQITPQGLVDQASAAVNGMEQAQPTPQPEAQPKALSTEYILDPIWSAGAGAFKAGFETYDFLNGETPQSQRSDFRKGIEQQSAALENEHWFNGVSRVGGQLSAGLVGVGKFLKAFQWGKAALTGVEATEGAATSGYIVGAAKESAKAALAGSVVFDPYEGRLSDLLAASQYPVFNNAVTQYLKTDPKDSEAESRFKGALEGIGLDAAVAIPLALSAKILKAARHGDKKATQAAIDELDAHQAAEAARTAQIDASKPAPLLGQDVAPNGDKVQMPMGSANDNRLVVSPANTDAPTNAVQAQATGTDGLGVQPTTPQAPVVDVTGTNQSPVTPGAQPPAPANDGLPVLNGGNDNVQAANRNDAAITPPGVRPANENTQGASQSAPLPWGAPANDVRPGPLPTVEELVPQGSKAPDSVLGPGGPVAPEVRAPEGTQSQLGADAQKIGSPDQQKVPRPRIPEVPEGTVSKLIDETKADLDLEEQYGGIEKLTEAGKLPKRDDFPWQALKQEPQVEAFLTRLSKELEPYYNEVKGGAVQSDAYVNKTARTIAKRWNRDPVATLSQLQALNKADRSQAARLEASLMLSDRALIDAYTLSKKIALGNLDEYGGSVIAASRELAQRMGLASALSAQARSILSNAGRTLRRGRGDLAKTSGFTYKDLGMVASIPADALTELVYRSAGDLTKMRQLMKPQGFGRKVWNAARFVQINGLLSSVWTQAVNLATGTSALVLQPMGHYLGASLSQATGAMSSAEASYYRTVAVKQVGAYRAALYDSTVNAIEALTRGNGILDPGFSSANDLNKSVAGLDFTTVPGWRDVNDPVDALYNVMKAGEYLAKNPLEAGKTALSVPTRFMGGTDELVKQLRYRSFVVGKAQADAITRGLSKAETEQFIKNRLEMAFDGDGLAMDMDAMEEARLATLSSALPQGSVGASVQTFAAQHPWMGVIAPFIKGPFNAIYQGLDMTPGINMLRRSYRDKFFGKQGPLEMVRARGQMAMGSLVTAATVGLAMDGFISGAGPSDPKARQAWLAAGNVPFSLKVTKPDGKIVRINLTRFDPVALPLTIAADFVDILRANDFKTDNLPASVTQAMGAYGLAMTEQVTNRTFLTGLANVLKFINNPRDADQAGWWAGSVMRAYTPYSGALKMLNPDPYMRQVRSALDGVIAITPGLSDKLPARYDVYGDPVLARNSMYTVSSGVTAVDQEMERLAIDTGKALGPPAYDINGVDLRDFYLEDGTNAYAKLNELAGHPKGASSLKETLAEVVNAKEYALLPDGEADVQGTRLHALAAVAGRYRRNATQQLLQLSPALAKAVYAEKLKAAGVKQEDPKQTALQAFLKNFGIGN